MATYSYKCNVCETVVEVQHSMKEDKRKTIDCPKCKKETDCTQVIGAGTFMLIGGGWHGHSHGM